MSGESGYMPRNFSELKTGGTIPLLSSHAEKWGDASPPSPSDRRPWCHVAIILKRLGLRHCISQCPPFAAVEQDKYNKGSVQPDLGWKADVEAFTFLVSLVFAAVARTPRI